MTSLQDRHAAFVDALGAYEQASALYAEAVDAWAALEDQRALVKDAAIQRLMQPTTEGAKPLSATAAEKIVESDADYAAHLVRLRAAARAKILTFTKMESARLTGMALAKGDY